MAVRLFAVGMPVALLNTILMNFYQSTGKTGLAIWICILQSLVFTVIMAFILIRPMGSTGVWTAFLLGEVFTLITIVLYVAHKNGKFSLKIPSYMLFEEGFGIRMIASLANKSEYSRNMGLNVLIIALNKSNAAGKAE